MLVQVLPGQGNPVMLKMDFIFRHRLPVDGQIQNLCPVKLQFEILFSPSRQFELDAHSPKIS